MTMTNTELMDKSLAERLVSAFERIAAALERAYPGQFLTVGTSPATNAPYVPSNPPYVPPIAPYIPPTISPEWPTWPRVTCGGFQLTEGVARINAMSQADGQGDDSGTRGD